MLKLTINGTSCEVDADTDRPLLGVLRDDLGLTGAKYGCGEGQCGACMVLVDDQPLPACIMSVGAVAGRDVVTVEGLADGTHLHPLQRAFLDQEAFQCGYCTPGMLIAGVGMLKRHAAPGRSEIVAALQANICRCGAYRQIICAVESAAAAMRSTQAGGDAR